MAPNSKALLLTQDSLLVEDVRAACLALGYDLRAVPSAFEAEKIVVEEQPSLILTGLHSQEGEGLGVEFAKSVRESMGQNAYIVGLVQAEEEKETPFERSGVQLVFRMPIIFPQFAKDLQFRLNEYFS